MENTVMTACNLSVGYRGNLLLSDLSFNLQRGRLTCLLGANGRGKSTLLRTLGGTLRPLGGRVMIGDKDIAGMSALEMARRVAIVSTDHTAAGALTVAELASLGRQPYTGFFGRLDAHDRSVVDESLASVGLGAEMRDRYVATLSDGERQRAMIARALAQDSDIILLDEPTAFLDVAARLETFALLRRLASERGKAILMSTHDVTEALGACDDAWLIVNDADDGSGAKSRIVTGQVSELVDKGMIGELFDSREIKFDPATRSFRL